MILITGQSGIFIEKVIKKITSSYVKFEHLMIKEHLRHHPGDKEDYKGPGALPNLLLKPKPYLDNLWRKTVDQIRNKKFLMMHTVYYHNQNREFFSCVNVKRIKKIKIDKIITLVDDIFDIYKRLRESGQMFDPDLSGVAITDGFDVSVKAVLHSMTLLEWRAVEISLSELLAQNLRIPHYVLAVKHPVKAANDLVASAKKIIYVSHPISQVRVLSDTGKKNEAKKIERQIHKLTMLLSKSDNMIPIFPTSIDELIIKGIIKKKNEYFIPQLRKRWTIPEPKTLLYIEPKNKRVNPLDPANFFKSKKNKNKIKYISPLLSALKEMIQRQINSRDHKLVDQCKAIIVYRPYFNGKTSKGVEEEISYRTRLAQHGIIVLKQKKCYICSPKEDISLLRINHLIDILEVETSNLKTTRKKRLKQFLIHNTRFKKFCDGTWKSSELRKEVEFVFKPSFRKIPTDTHALGPELSAQRRNWLNDMWDQIVGDINKHHPLRRWTGRHDVWFEEAMTPNEFVKRIENELKRWK